MKLTKMSSNKNFLQYLRYIVHLKKSSDQAIFAVHANLSICYIFLFTLLRSIYCSLKFGKMKLKIQLTV